MTDDQTVTQALEPCPFCRGEARLFTIGENEPENAGGDVISCTKCGASSHVEFGRKENLVDRWNTRTVHSGDLAPGLERAALWHDARCKGPDVFEQELHEVSAKALRHLAANPDATDMQALDAAHSGEGRSNGAGEDGYLKIPTEAMPRGPRRDAVLAAAMKLAPYSADPAGTPTRDGLVLLNAAINEAAAAHFAALSAPQGEVERLREALSDLWGIVHGCDLRLSVSMETIAKVRAALTQSEGAKSD